MARGFSLVEVLVALAIALAVAASTISLVEPVRSRFGAQLESADVQQRVRNASETLYRDLMVAGSGSDTGDGVGPLAQFLAPVRPDLPDGIGEFRADAISLMYVPQTASQTTLAQPLPARSSLAVINLDPGCPVANDACGFEPDTTVLVYDHTGAHDVFEVNAVAGPVLDLSHVSTDWSKIYDTGSKITRIVRRAYVLDPDPLTGAGRLVRVEGGRTIPVVDHVVGLAFEYFGETQPPTLLDPGIDRSLPWTRSTTYGPGPPPADVSWSAYPIGENCTFFLAGGEPTPRLTTLVPPAGQELAPLGAAELTDGPWCPDDTAPGRFDADLLRLRSIVVTVRVESGDDALRGPAGVWFRRGGTATSAAGRVPDQEIRFGATPRNLPGGVW